MSRKKRTSITSPERIAVKLEARAWFLAGLVKPTVPVRAVPRDWLAPEPGWVLRPDTTYAYVVLCSWGDAESEPLGAPPRLLQPLQGRGPGGSTGPELLASAEPLRTTLPDLGVAAEDIAARIGAAPVTGLKAAGTVRICAPAWASVR